MNWFNQLSIANKIALAGVVVAIITLVASIFNSPNSDDQNVYNINGGFNKVDGDFTGTINNYNIDKNELMKILKSDNGSENNEKIYSDIFSHIAKKEYDIAIKKVISAENNNSISKKTADEAKAWIERFISVQELPNRINAIIFKATSHDFNIDKAGEYIERSIPNFTYTTKNEWIKQENYGKTIIVYIKPEYKNVANFIKQVLYNKAQVQNYKNTIYMGLESRDIAIFIGDDYQDIFHEKNQ